MITNSQSIAQKAFISLKWSASIEVISRTASPIIFVIMARFLTPDDFGIMATVMIVISFVQMFIDSGLNKALIQTKESLNCVGDIVFWINLALGISVYVLLFLTAPWIAVFFQSPASASVLRVLGIYTVISSLASVQQALLVRQLDFQHLFLIKLFTAFFPAFFSIPLAFYGYGVWALVAVTLSGQSLNTVLLWRKSNWRPRMSFDFNLAKKIFRFGIWSVGESFVSWLIMWGDNLVVGKFLGIIDLGVYRTGWMLVTIIFGLLLNPILPILYPTFSRLQDDSQSLYATFHRANKVVIALALPIGIGILFVGSELADVLFGNKWQGMGFVVSTIGFMLGMAWLVGINQELYRAIGKPELITKLSLITIIYYAPAYYIAAQFGLKIFTIIRLIGVLLTIPMHIYLCKSMFGMSIFYIWHEGKYIIYATFFMAIMLSIAKSIMYIIMPSLQTIIALIILIVLGIAAYAGSLSLLDRVFMIQTKSLIKKVVVS